MVDDLSFMRVICASPDDDGLRLLYADFLDEKGDAASAARAEFIRVQCALAAAYAEDGNVDFLKSRERALLTTNCNDWLRPISSALGERSPGRSDNEWELEWLQTNGPYGHVIRPAGNGGLKIRFFAAAQFRSGFVAHVALFHRDSRGERHIARLWDQSPVDGLTLAAFDGKSLEKTLAAIDVTRLRSLEFLFTGDDSVELIARHERLTGLRELIFQGVSDRIDVADTIGRSSTLRQLRVLVFNQCSIGGEGIARLCRSPFASKLQRLEVHECDLTNDAAMHLTRYWPTSCDLQHLDLSSNRISGAGERALQERFGDILKTWQSDRPWPTRFYL